MATKKATRKSSSKRSGGARGFAQDRNLSIDKMVKDLQKSKQRSDAFVSDPGRVAKEYGVTLSKEEEYAVRFMNGLSIARLVNRFASPAAIFDNNCGCGGGGPASW